MNVLGNDSLAFYFAFPSNQDFPSVLFQYFLVGTITRLVFCNFCNPILAVRFWNSSAACAIMAMPKAAMNEYGQFPANKGNIRLAG